MRTRATSYLLAAALLCCPAAFARICSLDPVPAATLLFPFVVFDYANPTDGMNTVLSITNTGSDAVIVHVTLLTDRNLPLLDFNIALSGYDVETLDMRQILLLGLLPVTGTEGDLVVEGSVQALGPVTDVSLLPLPEGTDSLYPGCDPSNPAYPQDDPIPQGTLDFFKSYLQYVQILGDDDALFHWNCIDADLDGYIAEDVFQLDPDDWFQARRSMQPTWMYVVADVVQGCTKDFPDSAAYWAADMVSYDNVLMGDVLWVDDSTGSLEHEPAVHVEADPIIWDFLTWGDFGAPLTFYWPYTHDLLGPDQMPSPDRREPLPTAWALPYRGAGAAPGDTTLRVWKLWEEVQPVYETDDTFVGYTARDCEAYTYYAWDSDENVVVAGPAVPYQPNLLPLAVQEVSVDEFHIPDQQGWMLFQWPSTNNNYDPHHYQTWMAASYRPGPGPFDVNGDGELDSDDTARMLVCIYNPLPSAGCSPSDIDGSGTADAADLALLQARGLDEPAAATRAGAVMANFNCGQY